MLIFKQPEIGGEVPGHIDSTFLYTNPLSAVGFWIALEDCTLENGCMWFAPGSHKQYQIRQRFIRSNGSTAFIKLSDAQEPPSDAYVAVPVKKGTLVLIHGSVYHKSGPNRSSKSRWIYTFHCIEGQNEYPADNWLQTKAPFTKLF
ncbi:hypothetical protein EDD86DRAFT_206303 [Gorgonomyces haynaldii]|nr:hypothetical protein EDD86DRAFT_206303 [Gorgonomyces haynaldii]